MQADLIYQPESELRQWLIKHGKSDFIVFKDDQLKLLHDYFDSLDSKEVGSIGVDQLEDPLIAMGLVDNRDQVQKLVELVDEDGSGEIEFDEFLSIIKGGSSNDGDNGSAAIKDFFQKLTKGGFEIKNDKNMPFQLFVGYCRRRKLLNSMRSTDAVLKEQGTKILENYRKQSDAFVKRVKQEWEECKSEKSGSANQERKFLEQRI